MESTNIFEEWDKDFDPMQVRDWAYQAPDLHMLPYGKGINYLSRGLTLTELNQENMKDARAARISDTGYTLNKSGVNLGITTWFHGPDRGPEQMKFLPHVPLDEALSGDQPPITGFYPRIVFPPEGEFRYAILLNFDDNVVGNDLERISFEVPSRRTADNVRLPEDIKCVKGVRDALAKFFPDDYNLPSGEYTLQMEFERLPLLSVRIDGYRPIVSRMLKEGRIPREIPIVDTIPFRMTFIKDIFDNQPQRRDPLERIIRSTDKFAELGFVHSVETGRWFSVSRAVLQYQGKEDSAELMYVPLRRKESIEEVKSNPNQGLVEVQVDRVARLTNVDISYNPKEVKEPEEQETSDIIFNFREQGIEGSFDSQRRLSFHSSTTPVNVGKTVFANPKTGPVSPTVEAEWDNHLTTFRFCLTNDL